MKIMLHRWRVLVLAVAAPAVLSPANGSPPLHRELTFQERIDCQRAIERVYYSHQIRATRPFEEAVPEELLERKVRTYLRQSVALDELWHTPITAPMLKAELDRMAAGSQLPERFEEIYTALGHDPLLVMECFVRPVLADRLSRNFFAFDERIHGKARARAEGLREKLVRGEVDPCREHPLRSVVDGQTTSPMPRVREQEDAFVLDASLAGEPNDGHMARYNVPKRSWDDWWRGESVRFDEGQIRAVPLPVSTLLPPGTGADSIDPMCAADDTWDNGSLSKVPQSGTGPAVWTGTHMLVVGSSPLLKYDALTDTWTASAVANPVFFQPYSTAVWTGSVLIVWGGGSRPGNSGALYDPTADSWRPTSTIGAPSPRWFHTAIWTGSQMIVWGGSGQNTGGTYDPVGDTWTPTSLVGAPEGRSWHSAVWTGDRMIVWGGYGSGFLDNGGVYDPATDSWRAVSTVNAPAARISPSAVWTGDRMIVWGGTDPVNGGGGIDTGGVFDPETDSWQPTSTAGAPQGRANHAVFWTGQEMLIWGGELIGPEEFGGAGPGGRYDPATDTWRPITTDNMPDPRRDFAAVWTGDRMVVFGGYDPNEWVYGYIWPLYTGGRYDPVTDSWTPTASTSNGPSPPRFGRAAIWTGNEMILWGGGDIRYNAFASGKRYDPLTDSWRQMSMIDAPEGRANPAAVWTGDEMILWGGDHRIFTHSEPLSTGARYDPISDSWRPLSGIGAPQARALPSGVWTGERMIVWGGAIIGGVINTGGIYDPEADTWSPMTTVDAPEGRYFHTAVWTGDRMIIWGGDNGLETASFDTGGAYDPLTDTWHPTSMAGAPSARYGHAWVWTGRELFVFSGAFAHYYPALEDGALYDPVLDRWRPVSVMGAISGFALTAVWTGHEVLVWGPDDRGGRYDPFRDAWRPISTIDAPDTSGTTALWTGTHMLVWGSWGFGGRYVAYYPPDDDMDGFTTCGGDCDDADPSIYPGATEICDGKDNDCDNLLPAEEVDADGDGFMVCAGDCDDNDAQVNPAAADLPGNRADENCDGVLACDPDAPWANHGGFVSCVARECRGLVEAGAVTAEECARLLSQVARVRPAASRRRAVP